MQLHRVKILLDRLGFSWMVGSEEEISEIELSQIKPIHLLGIFDTGFALGEYSLTESDKRKRTPLGNLLHKFKYEQNQRAGELLADLASDFINGQDLLKSSDLMLTVPSSFRSRSFDPVSFLAERLEKRIQIYWERESFRRTRLAKPQKNLRDKPSKLLNVFDTFQWAKPLRIDGEKILLIDDIFDSGVTLNEISAILRQAGAEKIYVLVLAKAGFVEWKNSSNFEMKI